MKNYVVTSLEMHLFFGRIMKEHALFLLASFPEGESNYRNQSDWYREQFEEVLEYVVRLADGKVRNEVLDSGEVVTDYTYMAERQTNKLTGISIDSEITQATKNLQTGNWERPDRETVQRVRNLNQKVFRLLNGLISLKESILRDVCSCNLYTSNYPLLIEHIMREAKWYRQMVMDIENGRFTSENNSMRTEMFWNQIMMEHAQFIRGLLDPTECELIDTADEFADMYKRLLEEANQQDCRMQEELTRRARRTTEKYRDFKDAGTKGIAGCEIRSVILPLLADHVLREANHYLRLLKEE